MARGTLSTTAPFGFKEDPARFLQAFKAIGCVSCQFFRNRENPVGAADALRVSAQVGLPFDSIHGVFGPDLDPTSTDASHRAHCLKVYEDEGKLALDLGGPMVVVHPSTAPAGGLTRDQAAAQQRARWPIFDDVAKRLAEIGERIGVTYLVENLMGDCPLGHDPIRLAEHVMTVGSSRLRMCFDTGHAHATLSRGDPTKAGAVGVAIKVCASAISYIHVHDNDGVRDAHLMPGRGMAHPGSTPSAAASVDGAGVGIDWASVGEAIEETECGAIRMLEVFEDPRLAGPVERVAGDLRAWLRTP